jgi:hypothetical protein
MTREEFVQQLQAKSAGHTECRADDGEHACYDGQWTVHGGHDYEVLKPNWRGGGKGIIHCPGKTPDTILGASAGGAS